MSVLATTFSIVWTSVALYVAWIGSQQRSMAQRLASLELKLGPDIPHQPRVSKVA
jgi:CcmD family protein